MPRPIESKPEESLPPGLRVKGGVPALLRDTEMTSFDRSTVAIVAAGLFLQSSHSRWRIALVFIGVRPQNETLRYF